MVVVGPSGVGKGTLIAKIRDSFAGDTALLGLFGLFWLGIWTSQRCRSLFSSHHKRKQGTDVPVRAVWLLREPYDA